MKSQYSLNIIRKPFLSIMCIILLAPMLSACGFFDRVRADSNSCFAFSNPTYVGAPSLLSYKSFDNGENIFPEYISALDAQIDATTTGGNLIDIEGRLAFAADQPGTYEVTISNNSPGFKGGTCTVEITVLEPILELTASPPKILRGTSSEISITWKGNLDLTQIVSVGDDQPDFSSSLENFPLDSVSLPIHITVSPLETTQYTVEASFHNPYILQTLELLKLTGAVTVEVLDFLAIASADPQAVMSGNASQLSVEVQGGTPPYSYQWDLAGDESTPADTPNPVVHPQVNTTYKVVVTDSVGNQASDSVMVEIIQPTPTFTPTLPEFDYTHQFCGPNADLLTLRFQTDQVIEDASQFQALISVGASEVVFNCYAAAYAPDSLFCIGPGSVGGQVRPFSLVDTTTGEVLLSSSDYLDSCDPTSTPQPEHQENNSGYSPPGSTPTSTQVPSATPTEEDGDGPPPSPTPNE